MEYTELLDKFVEAGFTFDEAFHRAETFQKLGISWKEAWEITNRLVQEANIKN